MPRALRKLAPLLVALLLAAAGLAACGGGGSQDPAAVLGQTFANKRPINSGRLSLKVDVTGAPVAGLPSPFHLALGGPFATNPGGSIPKFQFDLSLGSGAQTVDLGVVSTGAHGWLQIGGKAFTLPDASFAGLGKGRPTTGTSSSGLKLSDLGVDPERWLVNPKVEGGEDLGGEQVTHVSSGVDVPRLLDDLGRVVGGASKLGLNGLAGVGSALSPSTRASLEQAVQDAHVDVWTGERDRILRRIRIAADVEGTNGKPGKVLLDLSLARVNQPQPIGPPANPRPLSELTSALQALAVTSGTGATGASGAAAQTYDDCIAQAGSDLAAAQRCSSLIGR